jgi:hypothetical protein
MSSTSRWGRSGSSASAGQPLHEASWRLGVHRAEHGVRPRLADLLQLYTRDDGFTRAARRAQRIQYGLPSQSGNRVEH